MKEIIHSSVRATLRVFFVGVFVAFVWMYASLKGSAAQTAAGSNTVPATPSPTTPRPATPVPATPPPRATPTPTPSISSRLRAIGGLSPNLLSVAKALDSAAGDPRAAHLFKVLDSSNPNQLLSDIQHINPEQLTSTSSVGNSVSGVHAQNLQMRMADLRAGATGFSSMGFHTAGNPTDYSIRLGGAYRPRG